MEACIHLNCPVSECWRYNMIIVPCVRLVCSPVCSQDTCFHVELEVMLELFLIQWVPFCPKPPKPACPDLPLYPQPCKDPCRCC